MNRLPFLDITPATTVAGRLLTSYVELHAHRDSHHSTNDIVGYVVRETIRDGKILKGADPLTCGYDIQAVEGGPRYSDLFGLRDHLREGRGYAVIDSLYACGCRSGRPIPQPEVAPEPPHYVSSEICGDDMPVVLSFQIRVF